VRLAGGALGVRRSQPGVLSPLGAWPSSQWVGVTAIRVERWVSRLTGAANVRQVTLFPRDPHRSAP
jgi:hypothetical protein